MSTNRFGCLSSGSEEARVEYSSSSIHSDQVPTGLNVGNPGFLNGNFPYGQQFGGIGMPIVAPPMIDTRALEIAHSVGRAQAFFDDWKAMWSAYYAAFQSGSRCASSVASSAASISASIGKQSVASSELPSPVLQETTPMTFKKKRDKFFSAVGKVRGVVKEQKTYNMSDGYCYLRAVREERRSEVAERIGAWPTVSALVNHLDPRALYSTDVLRHIGVVYEDDIVHVTSTSTGCNFFSFLASIRSLAGSAHGALAVVGDSSAFDPVHLACKVGGQVASGLVGSAVCVASNYAGLHSRTVCANTNVKRVYVGGYLECSGSQVIMRNWNQICGMNPLVTTGLKYALAGPNVTYSGSDLVLDSELNTDEICNLFYDAYSCLVLAGNVFAEPKVSGVYNTTIGASHDIRYPGLQIKNPVEVDRVCQGHGISLTGIADSLQLQSVDHDGSTLVFRGGTAKEFAASVVVASCFVDA